VDEMKDINDQPKDQPLKLKVTIQGREKHRILTPMGDVPITKLEFLRLFDMLYKEVDPHLTKQSLLNH